jgi:hypothetical protein
MISNKSPQPVVIKPILHRLYYDNQGLPLFFSQEELSGNYIDVDLETFINPPNHIRVVNGKLTVMDTCVVTMIKPEKKGTPCHPQDVSIVVDEKLPHIKWNII